MIDLIPRTADDISVDARGCFIGFKEILSFSDSRKDKINDSPAFESVSVSGNKLLECRNYNVRGFASDSQEGTFRELIDRAPARPSSTSPLASLLSTFPPFFSLSLLSSPLKRCRGGLSASPKSADCRRENRESVWDLTNKSNYHINTDRIIVTLFI